MMPGHEIRKVLIANRGEIAVRIIRTCKELGITTAALYSDADRAAPHVMKADEAYPVGPPPAGQSYLVMERILAIAQKAGADAIHPGYGFLSENPVFAKMVTDAGLVFIGPSSEAIRRMGDKTEARRLVQRASVPVVPGSENPVGSEREIEIFVRDNGLPILIKAAGGGGGKGMRIVRSEGEISAGFRAAQREARSAFGDPRVYVEKYLDHPRHVEFQVLADGYGSTVHLGERECSIQRRHQKLVEESPSVALDEDLREAMGVTAVKAAQACGYQNAGTIEFLLDRDNRFYFLEMNTRLQVEHPVTEMRTGIDIVAEQIRIAAGERLRFDQRDIKPRGHAIECRICAEDVENDFFPETGTITHLRPGEGPGVREDRGVEEGGEIPVFYDSMISKLIVWAPTRPQAIERMKRALREYEILGIRTTIPACLFIMGHERFNSGDFDTHFLQDYFAPANLPRPDEQKKIALAVLCAYLEDATDSAAITGDGDGDIRRVSAWSRRDGLSTPAQRGWKSQRFSRNRS